MSTSDIEKQEKKRAMIINEIVSSEQTYLTRLLITRDVFMRPIQDKSLLSKEDIDGQFGELNAIVNLHEILSHSLTQAHEQGTLEVGRVFSDICSEFSVYKGYLKCFEKALVKRGKLITSNRKFADYLVEAKADPRCQGFSMESLLIEPVQRIPRYRLLLEDLLKSTLPSHTDYESIKNALESICIIAAENNEAIRQQEELDKVYQVMQQMEYKGSINLLDNEDRKFLKQNDLMRQCRRGRKSFRFWLFNDLLLYGEASKPLILGKYNLNRDIPLNQCNVSSEDEGEEYVMTVESPSKSFIVWFQDRVLRDEWVNAIDTCIKQCRCQGGEAVALAPIWNPDSASKLCAICSNEFSFLNRKHHCRNCKKRINALCC
jgi:FYVE/RhoGEF/PH domain-containing protein 5/6